MQRDAKLEARPQVTCWTYQQEYQPFIVKVVNLTPLLKRYHMRKVTRSSATAESTARPILKPFESSYATSY